MQAFDPQFSDQIYNEAKSQVLGQANVTDTIHVFSGKSFQ